MPRIDSGGAPMPIQPPEFDFGKGISRFMGNGFINAVALLFSHVYLANPAGSGILAVIERIECVPLPADGARMGPVIDITLGAVESTVASIDRRNLGAPTCEVRRLQQVGLNISLAYNFNVPAEKGSAILERPGIILPPGTGFGCNAPVFVACQANFLWTERPA